MGIGNLNDEKLKEFVEDPKKFLSDTKNLKQMTGLDSTTKRRVADIMQYEVGLSKDEVKDRISRMRFKENITVRR